MQDDRTTPAQNGHPEPARHESQEHQDDHTEPRCHDDEDGPEVRHLVVGESDVARVGEAPCQTVDEDGDHHALTLGGQLVDDDFATGAGRRHVQGHDHGQEEAHLKRRKRKIIFLYLIV